MEAGNENKPTTAAPASEHNNRHFAEDQAVEDIATAGATMP
jgi:hypothetical protein